MSKLMNNFQRYFILKKKRTLYSIRIASVNDF